MLLSTPGITSSITPHDMGRTWAPLEGGRYAHRVTTNGTLLLRGLASPLVVYDPACGEVLWDASP